MCQVNLKDLPAMRIPPPPYLLGLGRFLLKVDSVDIVKNKNQSSNLNFNHLFYPSHCYVMLLRDKIILI